MRFTYELDQRPRKTRCNVVKRLKIFGLVLENSVFSNVINCYRQHNSHVFSSFIDF